MRTLIAAKTKDGFNYPSFINISAHSPTLDISKFEDGDVVIKVRGEAGIDGAPGPMAEFRMTVTEFRDYMKEVNGEFARQFHESRSHKNAEVV